MTDFLRVEIRIPLHPHQTRMLKEEWETLPEKDRNEYVRLILMADHILVDKVEPVFADQVIPTFCGTVTAHEQHTTTDPRFGAGHVLACPGIA